MEQTTSGRTLYGVIIEWGGQEPPGKWYRTMRHLTGFSVRSRKVGKALGGVAPRTVLTVPGDLADDLAKVGMNFVAGASDDPRSNDFGGIAQEGAIIVASYTLARTLYLLLDEGFTITDHGEEVLMKPEKVYFMTLTIEDSFGPSPADAMAMARIRATLGKRGPRPKEKPYAITCYECQFTYGLEVHAVLRCPKCGGQHIRPRQGQIAAYADPGGDLVGAWLRTRFGNGHWEFGGWGTTPAPEAAAIKISDPDELGFVRTLVASPLLGQLAGLERAEQMAVLDAAMTIRLRWQPARRSLARTEALVQYFILGGSHLAVKLAEGKTFDMFDAAGIMGKDFVASHMFDFLAAPPIKGGQERELTLRYEAVEEGA